MFKINFLKKKKEVSLENLNKKEKSPKRDWLIIIIISVSIVLLSGVFSAFLFFGSVDGDIFENNDDSDHDFVIQESRLDAAVEFIQSRSSE